MRAETVPDHQEAPGILNVNKPAGMTSHDVVAAVRRMSGQKRVGHAGTLDPLATGVLLICLGQATRVIEYLQRFPKVYCAQIRLGVVTDTYDAEGEVISEVAELNVSRDQIEEVLPSFMGQIEQVPPLYSALKHKGQPLYKLARQGIEIEREARVVEIYRLQITDWTPPLLELEVECSKGTYIRSLAHDLGQMLGCGAHLSKLVRRASGHFTLEESISLADLKVAFSEGYWTEFIYSMDAALLEFEAVIVDQDTALKIAHGQEVELPKPLGTALCRAYTPNGLLLALLEHSDTVGLWQPKKVFLSPQMVWPDR
ncbi:MAG: tRNA pseudouridine(55) synthase TruB [Anaerolineae bacterium]